MDNYCFFDILVDDIKVGGYGLSFYDDIRAVGIGSLEIFPEYRGKGYGKMILNDIIERYRDSYDLIYCFVDRDNSIAIDMYNGIGKVFYDDADENGRYYVELLNADGSKRFG